MLILRHFVSGCDDLSYVVIILRHFVSGCDDLLSVCAPWWREEQRDAAFHPSLQHVLRSFTH